MNIVFIQTGGTIDKDYPRGLTHHGYEFAIGEPAIKSILAFSRVMFSYEMVEVVKKDSLDLTDADRQQILEAVARQKSDKIIITHGTDTLLKTAEVLNAVQSKTIILTGAMLPEKFKDSDAQFNVGMAIGAVQSLPPGVYIALFGRVTPWQSFDKLRQEYETKTKR